MFVLYPMNKYIICLHYIYIHSAILSIVLPLPVTLLEVTTRDIMVYRYTVLPVPCGVFHIDSTDGRGPPFKIFHRHLTNQKSTGKSFVLHRKMKLNKYYITPSITIAPCRNPIKSISAIFGNMGVQGTPVGSTRQSSGCHSCIQRHSIMTYDGIRSKL